MGPTAREDRQDAGKGDLGTEQGPTLQILSRLIPQLKGRKATDLTWAMRPLN